MKSVLELLEHVKPCNCGQVVYSFDIYPDHVKIGEDVRPYVRSHIGAIINVHDLGDVGYTYIPVPKGFTDDADNLSLTCPACGKDWSAWNLLLCESTAASLKKLI